MYSKTSGLKTLCFVFACLFLQNFNIGGKGIEIVEAKAANPVCNHIDVHSTQGVGHNVRLLPHFTDKEHLDGFFSDQPLYSIRKIVLDAGHGGKDPGCHGRHSQEKHNVLAITLQLGSLINQYYPEVEVIYTRSTDVFIPLHERARIANDANADLFVSVHCNALPSVRSVHGTETYILGQHVADDNLEVMLRENSSIYLEENYEQNYAGYDPNSPEAHIMGNMMQNAFLEQSLVFADFVQKQANKYTGLRDRGVKQAGFLVLRETSMPSVLVETGYLTNKSDEAYLMTADGQLQMAISIFEAFKQYKYTYETGSNPSPTVQQQGNRAPRMDTTKQLPVLPVKIQKPLKTGYTQKVIKTAETPKEKGIVQKSTVKTPKAIAKANNSKDTPFTILLLQSDKAVDKKKSNLDIVPDVYEKKENGKFRYFVGNFATHKDATIMLGEVRNLGFPTAQIVFKTY